jgi:NAD(P)-dependent dehydrogenase (short-subunit alcohol dehydrogenase family)
MRLENKVCVITGGAQGMGALACSLFAKEGAKVVSADVVQEAGDKLVSQIKKEGGDAHFVKTDVTREEDCAKAIQTAVKTYGGLDVLYNNAGIFPPDDHSVIDTPLAVWDKILSVNLKGIVSCSKFGVPEIIKRGGGSVINIASFTALLGCTVPQDAYASSKGAVISLTKSMAVQFGPKKVRSNVICPGPIETPMITEWLLTNPVERNKRLPRIPLGRFGQPQDVVYMALHLASDESAWTNGSVIVIDGGITSNYF